MIKLCFVLYKNSGNFLVTVVINHSNGMEYFGTEKNKWFIKIVKKKCVFKKLTKNCWWKLLLLLNAIEFDRKARSNAAFSKFLSVRYNGSSCKMNASTHIEAMKKIINTVIITNLDCCEDIICKISEFV